MTTIQGQTESRRASTRPLLGSSDAVLMLSDRTRLLRWNRTAALLFDIPADSTRGLRLDDLPRYGQLVPAEVRAALLSPSRETTWRGEIAQPTSSGARRFAFSVTGLGGGEGDAEEALLVIRDVTPIHPPQRANASESLGDPIAICAHCKSLSSGPDEWQSVETYLAEHSGARCRQEMCPACVRTLYPELCHESQLPSPTVEAT